MREFGRLIFRRSLPEVEQDDYSVRIRGIVNSPPCLLMKINDDNNNFESFIFFLALQQDLSSLT